MVVTVTIVQNAKNKTFQYNIQELKIFNLKEMLSQNKTYFQMFNTKFQAIFKSIMQKLAKKIF